MKSFSIIVAVDHKFGIGKSGGLPWHLLADLKHFKTITTRPPGMNVVVMGRKTWDSLPPQRKPLPNRINIVLSRQSDLVLPPGVQQVNNLNQAFENLPKESGEIFIIGGGEIFKDAITSPLCQKLYITHVERDFSCDVFFPDVSEIFTEVVDSRKGPFLENGTTFYFCEYQRNKILK